MNQRQWGPSFRIAKVGRGYGGMPNRSLSMHILSRKANPLQQDHE